MTNTTARATRRYDPNALTDTDVLPHWPLYRLTVARDPDAPAPTLRITALTRVPTDYDNPKRDRLVQHRRALPLTGNRQADAHATRRAQSRVIAELAQRLADTPMGGTHPQPHSTATSKHPTPTTK